MEGSRHLSRWSARPVHLKCENLQRTGSFKIRGAYVRIAGLQPGGAGRRAWSRRAPATTRRASRSRPRCSACARRSSCRSAPRCRRSPRPASTAPRCGCTAQVVDETLAAAQRVRRARPARSSSTPSTTPTSSPGRARSAWRSWSSARRCARSSSGIGGGGLAAGIAVAVKALRPDVRIVGVQAAGAAAYPPSLAAGRPVALEHRGDDGRRHHGRAARRRAVRASSGNWWTRSRTVTEDELSPALLLCLERAKLVVEPAGASPVAALLADAGRASRARWWRCCPAATWTRCCSSASCGTACRRPGRYLVAAAAADRPARGARDASRGVVSGGR